MGFSNMVAISTGAASGMGLLFAENFASLGGNVVMCDVNGEALNEKVSAINEKGVGKAIGVICDVRNYAEVCAARDKAVAVFGRIDIMANFAGGTAVRMCKVDKEQYPEFPDVPIDVYDWGIDVNLKGPFYFAHAVLKQMREQKSGLIINIGSITGAEGDRYGMDYPTSKAGLMYGLTKSIAQFGEKYGIRCVCVSPGPVLTRAAMSKMKTLLGRAAEPQEIIDLVLFIASDKGQFINGENIMIDGGRNAMGRWK
jgi:3-oxoacyl-[acyl-carrier protein] reductase